MATLAKTKHHRQALQAALTLAGVFRHFPGTELYADFDVEADVLYLNFQRPQKATETIEVNNGEILLHFRHRDLVGITILNVSLQGEALAARNGASRPRKAVGKSKG